jgi:hypothetical protein
LGLIDKQATYDQALKLLGDKIGISKYQVVTNTSNNFLASLLQNYFPNNKISSKSTFQDRILLIYGDPLMYQ